MTIVNIEKYDQIMNELREMWKDNENEFVSNRHWSGGRSSDTQKRGIRSSQIAALVALLVEKGVFDD